MLILKLERLVELHLRLGAIWDKLKYVRCRKIYTLEMDIQQDKISSTTVLKKNFTPMIQLLVSIWHGT